MMDALSWCLHGSKPALLVGLVHFAEISPPCEISCNICFHLYVRRASPPKRDLTIDYPRSRQEGWNFLSKQTQRGWPSYNASALDPAQLERPENSHVKAR